MFPKTQAFVSVWIRVPQFVRPACAMMASTRSRKKVCQDVEPTFIVPGRKRAKLSVGEGPSTNPRDRDESLRATEDTSKTEVTSSESYKSNFYLFKSEPEPRLEKGKDVSFSIDDLARREDQVEPWDGVRNYEARNTMQRMRAGEYGFFYVRLYSPIPPLACEELSMYVPWTWLNFVLAD
jgi:EVE domain